VRDVTGYGLIPTASKKRVYYVLWVNLISLHSKLIFHPFFLAIFQLFATGVQKLVLKK
jgi:hypothetical protein